jgi:hypothetical protein
MYIEKRDWYCGFEYLNITKHILNLSDDFWVEHPYRDSSYKKKIYNFKKTMVESKVLEALRGK